MAAQIMADHIIYCDVFFLSEGARDDYLKHENFKCTVNKHAIERILQIFVFH